MARAVFRKSIIAAALAGLAATAVPLAAQGFSEGYEFLKAVKERNGEDVTTALNEPGSIIVNTRDITTGETALHIVTKRRDLTWIRFLTGKGGNPNIADNNGVTPLTVAASLGFVEGVEALVNAGARVDDSNASGETALIAATHRRDVAMVRLLLAKGANPDRTDNSGRSARDYVSLMSGNARLLEEFASADAAREAAGVGESYGPSF